MDASEEPEDGIQLDKECACAQEKGEDHHEIVSFGPNFAAMVGADHAHLLRRGFSVLSEIRLCTSSTESNDRLPYGYPIMAGLWLAKETGAFEQYGLKTDLLFISSGPTTVQAMIGGHVDVSFAASNAVISSILGGAPLVAVGSVSNRPATTLWVQPEITRPEQLEGKLMGVTRLGSASHFLTLMVLEKLGLKEKAKIQPFGGGAEADAAFRAGIVAGRVGSVRPAPQARMMMDVSKLDIAYSMDLIIVKRDFLKNSPKTVENILRGYIDGAVALRANKNKASKVIGKYMRLRPESVGEQTMNENYNDALRSTDVEPRVEPAVIKNVLNWLGKSNVGIDQFFDNTIVDQILREGFIPEAYKRNRSG